MAEADKTLKWWVRGDLDGFFGLFSNSMANTLAAIFLISVVAKMPNDIVFGSIVPAVVLSLAFGNIYFALQAVRLAKKEGRADVTAVPYGISVPHYFIVTFAIFIPVLATTHDPMRAWSIGVAWCFVHAIVVAICAFIGPWLRKVTPRAAMLGTLAGVALTYIAANAAFQAFDVAWLALVCFGILLFGWFAQVRFPFNLPAGLVAILVGTVLGWITGVMQPGPLHEAAAHIGFNAPIPQLQILFNGLPLVEPYLVTAIPLAIYLFMETLLNVESAEVGGDKYSARETTLAAAAGTAIGAIFGSPLPTLVYIGHPGWKSVGARVGYSWATGVAMLLLGCFGLLGPLLKIIPIEAVLPILIYIGMVVTSQAFNEVPKNHAPAVALALLPWLADWARTLINNALGVAGTSAAKLGNDALEGGGVAYGGMSVFGNSPIIVGALLGAIAAYIIDKNFRHAGYWAVFGAVASYFGVVHGTEFKLGAAPGPAIGYILVALLCGFYAYQTRNTSPAATAAN
ncbi:MAG TPA: regulator [Xanthobacteraceae bacterium]|jgi:AGZA family xanthine/uracil permease-like MFS transporter|nr:regulator [Xanthobacteraceae bacterium]